MSVDAILRSYDKEYPELQDETKNKVIFNLNNCSNSNVDEKATEIRKILNEETLLKVVR